MARPAAASAFLRDPDSKWKHDGFGHDNQQDVGIRDLCFRDRPHSGLDFTGRGGIFSLAGGVVKASLYTAMAGWCLIEDVTVEGIGRFFPIYLHAEDQMVPAGASTTIGQQLGDIGDTGRGTSPGAYHLHLTIARTLEAALRYITYGTRARYKGETVQQWADAHGLVDPLPIVRALQSLQPVKPAPKPAPAPAPEPITEDAMFQPSLFINKTPSDGMRGLGVAIFPDGRVEGLSNDQWGAWQLLGSPKPVEVINNGHWTFLMQAAARARAANVLPAPVVPATLAKQIAKELGGATSASQVTAAIAGA